MESERPGLALIGHMALAIDQVQTIRPAGVGGFGGVAKLVQHRGQLDPKLPDARACDQSALFFILRVGEHHAVFDVALHLPDIAGMSLRDVDDQEAGAVLELVIEFVEGGNLPPEGRSSVAAENQDHGLALVHGRELDVRALVELGQIEIRSGITNIQVSGTSAQPSGLERKQQERHRAGHARHHLREFLRWLMHRPPDVTPKRAV